MKTETKTEERKEVSAITLGRFAQQFLIYITGPLDLRRRF